MFKYKKLYEIEKNNRKLLEERKRELSAENIELQKEVQLLKKEKAEAIMELETVYEYLRQEKECTGALRKERTKLRKKITELGGSWYNGKQKRN